MVALNFLGQTVLSADEPDKSLEKKWLNGSLPFKPGIKIYHKGIINVVGYTPAPFLSLLITKLHNYTAWGTNKGIQNLS